MTVTIEIKSNRKECEKTITDDLRKSFNKIGLLVRNQARNNVDNPRLYNSYKDRSAHPEVAHPMRQTGKLINNIGFVVKEENSELFTLIGLSKEIPNSSPVAYGKYLEMGTYKMPAYPWLRPAMITNEKNMVDILGHKAGFGLITD